MPTNRHWLNYTLPALATSLALVLPVVSAAAQGVADPALSQLVDEYWSADEALNVRSQLAEGKTVGRIRSGSLAEARLETRRAQQLLRHLRRLKNGGRLGPDDVVTADILEWMLGEQAQIERRWWYEFPVSPYTGLDLSWAMQAVNANPLRTPDERAACLSLLESIAARLEATRDRLQAQSRRGIRLPRAAAALGVGYFQAMQASYAALPGAAERRLVDADATNRAAFAAAVRARVSERIEPARLALVEDLRRASERGPESVGLSQYPGGRAIYRGLVKLHTTLDITPEEVMSYGMARLQRANAEIDAIARSRGIEGGRANLRAALAADPTLGAATPADLDRAYQRAVARIAPRLPEYFPALPRAPYGVRRLDASAEAGMTFGRYQMPTMASPRGEYLYNGSRLAAPVLVYTAAMIYHELIPGHHLQAALQLENEALPPFRRYSGNSGRNDGTNFTAYREGWAEYAVDVADEMRMLDDPIDRLGRLILDVFLSARLVVDPGMNYYGWSLEKARAFMRENTYHSNEEIDTETLRYSTAIPAQALAYKIGERSFAELRAGAAARRGDAFDVREFHDAVLAPGAMPLSVLGPLVERHFRSAGASPTPPASHP